MNTVIRNGGNTTHMWVCKGAMDMRWAGTGRSTVLEEGCYLEHVCASLWRVRTHCDLGKQGRDDSGSRAPTTGAACPVRLAGQ